MRLFSFRKLFCDFFLLFFCFFFGSLLGMVTEKRRGRVGRGEDAWCVQYGSIQNFFVHKELRIVIKSNASK